MKTRHPTSSGAAVWIDGRVVDERDARIPVKDHGFLYGDGIFEGIRIRARRVFRLEDHLGRNRCRHSLAPQLGHQVTPPHRPARQTIPAKRFGIAMVGIKPP